MLKKFIARLTHIPRRNYVFGLAAVVVLLLVFVAGLYAWDYTNAPPFCGTTCHTMPPQYASYLQSSHSRVSCVECHIGRTSLGVEITRKPVNARFVLAYATGNYTYPIFIKNLQPARETCEKCHLPEKFSWDKVVTLKEFLPDEKNTPTNTTLVLKTGGGTAREGLGRGIHWHIENPVNFYYTDDQQQNIPVIKVTNPDGSETVYNDITSPLTPDQLAKLPKREMDCTDCHNRTSHNFLSPDAALDTALQTKNIDATIPEIKKKGVEVLTPLYKTTEETNQTINNLTQFYQQNFPDYYKQNTAAVQNAVKVLKDTYSTIHYPDQKLDWTTHSNNIGHKDWPGCFRCHDGKHFTADKTQAIRLECNLCHSLPVVTRPDQANQTAASIALTKGPEPDSHKTTTWLLEHRNIFDASCQQCHDTRNAGGADNSSFCSNSACHGTKWKFAGFNAPALPQPKPSATPPSTQSNTPPNVPHDLTGRTDCLKCHGSGASGIPQVPQFHKDSGFANDMCLNCHKSISSGTSSTVAPTPSMATPSVSATNTGSSEDESEGPPSPPADHAGRTICLACHSTGASGAPKPPASHASFTDAMCLTCHKIKQ